MCVGIVAAEGQQESVKVEGILVAMIHKVFHMRVVPRYRNLQIKALLRH